MPSKSKSQQEKLCLNCGKRLAIKCQRDLVRKNFCSRSCNGEYYGLKKSKEAIDAMVASANTSEANAKKANHKEQHPNWKGGGIESKCRWCGELFQAHSYRVRSGNGKHCSRQCFLLWQASGAKKKPRQLKVCEICGNEMWLTPHQVKKRRFCSRRCTAVHAADCVPRVNTSIEIAVSKLLTKLGIEHLPQHRIKGITVVDFLVLPNIVIFCDGDYWHSLPGRRESDAKIDHELRELGFLVLRLPEEKIVTDLDSIERELRNLNEQ